MESELTVRSIRLGGNGLRDDVISPRPTDVVGISFTIVLSVNKDFQKWKKNKKAKGRLTWTVGAISYSSYCPIADTMRTNRPQPIAIISVTRTAISSWTFCCES